MLLIINILIKFIDNNHIMNSKKQILFPKNQQILEQMGENIKLARKRRKLTTVQVAERANIDRTTLYHIEKGNGKVSMAAYFNTLRVLGLHEDFLKIASDDEFGRKLQDLELLRKN
jgi:transcriptional regulator with XRE-family HTH domain